MPETQLLIPDYMKRFECIGSACEDTCCAGWTIRVDKPAYEKYTQMEPSALRERLVRNLTTRPVTEADDRFYAYFQPAEGNRCPMLDPDLLCSIQRTSGESHLSNVCSNFPRIFQQADNRLEMSGDIACPEIARLVLSEPDGLSFEAFPAEYDPWRHAPDPQDAKATDPDWTPFRDHAIELMQNREFTLSERIRMLTVARMDLLRMIVGGDGLSEAIWQQAFDISRLTGSARQAQSDDAEAEVRQFAVLKPLLDIRLEMGPIQERFAECYAEFLFGAGYLPEPAAEPERVRRLHAAYRDILVPYMENYSYIFENDLVNRLFQEPMPLIPAAGQESVLDDAFLRFLTRYRLILMGLCGIAACYGQLETPMVIKWIQSLSKTIDHHRPYRQKLAELARQFSDQLA